MLYISRKLGESVMIDGNIEVSVVEVRGKTAKLAFKYPDGTNILRKEVYDRIHGENLAAMDSAVILGELIK